MDQQSGDTADKRNWRERLGIGKNAGASDLPKLSNEFKDEGAPEGNAPAAPRPAAAHTPVKAAPMAPRTPRAGAAPVAPRAAAPPVTPASPRQAPVAPDALASKLRDQREAAERLAQQRIQAAKARAEAVNQSNQAATPAGAKPKFSFADQQDANSAGRPATPWPPAGTTPNPRPAAVPPAATPRPQFPPQMQPPRPQLGGATTPPPSYPPAGQSGYGQPYQAPYNPGYSNPYGQQPPSYRPIDPKAGYATPSGFNPRGNAPAGSRLPPATRSPSYTPAGQSPQLQIGPALDQESDGDDIFETAPQRAGGRRATANDYNQAYQDELDYDDTPQRSGSFGMVLGLLLLGVLVALGVVWGYSTYIKPKSAATGGNVPVVSAPATPTKATPDANTSQQGDAANKKLIYDRIEGDHEVPGGALKSTEQPPAATQQGGDAQQPGGGASNGDTSQPVPLPPPPGGNNGQQGALSPDANSSVANAIPAAGQNPAANSSQGGASSQAGGMNVTPTSAAPDANNAASAATPTGSQPAAQDASMPAPPAATTTAADENGDEQIGNTKAKPAAKPAAKTAAVDPTKTDTAKTKSLGSAPVVLVPPSKTAPAQTASAPIVAAKPTTPVATGGGGGLYGDSPAVAAPQQMASAAPQPPVVAAPSAVAPKTGTGAFVVKLSSFGSREEATQEYQRLSAKHGALITRYAPIITQSTVAGSTRYNLNLGPMASNDVASSVCSSLIAAGERDCAVQRQ